MPVKLNFNNTEIAYKSKTDQDLKNAALLFKILNIPVLSAIGNKIMQFFVTYRFPVNTIVKKTLYRYFCGGETLEECLILVHKLKNYNMHSVLDYGVEGKDNEDDMDKVMEEIMKNIKIASNEENIPFSVFKPTALGSFEIYKKVSSAETLNESEKIAWNRIKDRFDKISALASENKVCLFIDAEESWIQDSIDNLVLELMEKYNKESAWIWNTYQLYRTDRLERIRKDHEVAKNKAFKIGVKLVRGAYLEKERKRAKKHEYPSPVHKSKQDTDNDFNKAIEFCIENISDIMVCAATHNSESCMFLANLLERKNLPLNHPSVWFSQLYGMGDQLSFNLSHANYNVVKYIPYGPVKEVIHYLVRRAEENSSISGQAKQELNLIKIEQERRGNIKDLD